jgi:hypothetical protein
LAVFKDEKDTNVKMTWHTYVPWFLTIFTAAVGIWQFIVQQRQANRLPFLQRQLELCFQITETVGRLSSETDPIEWEKARVAFWRLYWGPLSIVEDRAVEREMVELGRLVPEKPVSSHDLPMSAIGVPAYRLAHAIRNLVLTSWQVNLPSLLEKRQ